MGPQQQQQLNAAKVLVVGSVNGCLPEFFAKVKKLDAKYGPFSILLITGNLFSSDADDSGDDISSLLKDEIAIPVMTYAVVGDRRLPQRVSERAHARAGEVCNNLVILSGQGVLQTSEGVKIAYIGGRYISQVLAEKQGGLDTDEGDLKDATSNPGSDTDGGHPDHVSNGPTSEGGPAYFDNLSISDLITQVATENEKALQKTVAQPSVDILLTYDWPYGAVSSVAGSARPVTQFASNKISYVSAAVMPRYHFAAGEDIFFERQPWKYSDRISVGNAPHFTRFIGLGPVNEPKHGKQRWFYAMNVAPLRSASQGTSASSELPGNCTINPLYRFGKVSKVLDTTTLPGVLSGIDGSNDADASESTKGGQGKRQPPPLDYVCHSCNLPGHWAQDCPINRQKRQRTENAPPAGYVCHRCNQSGHWKSDCPTMPAGDGRHASAEDALSKCWFCLANPDVDQNLMVAIGDEAYVAMAKGALVTSGSPDAGFDGHASPIPGGGHVLIVPIVHTDSLRKAREGQSEADQSLCAEIDRWIAAISSMFAEFDCVPLIFETSRCLPHVHTALQMIPLPSAKAESVRPVLDKLCAADKLAVESDYPDAKQDGYFAVTDPVANQNLVVHIPKRSKGFNLQLGRKLAAVILGVPERESWRQCTVPEDKEASERDRFIAAFAKHDFTQ
ncbi:hypothetical protein H4R23_004485 [Coemansia sp. Cherry 401B]|nr:hypothetical protein IWW54_003116 [Coemansia sp. RSA 2705]KAJ2722300.1 hypothetical protein H4R23_004485 [Coemansia sp. Cherry 401B]